MRPQDVSLIAPHLTKNSERFRVEGRMWQSAPSVARTRGGRIFCCYSADNNEADEKTTNYNVCAYSDNDGDSFQVAFYTYHDHDVRISETLVFLAPNGTLYHFWTQSYHYFDGRGGIWCVQCEEPDAPQPIFSEPRRLIDGFMADNPVILRDGRWIFPSSVWTHIKTPYHPCPEKECISVYESKDGAESFTYLGGTNDQTPDFTENTVFEKKDGTLVMLFRSQNGIRRAYSKDGGRVWTAGELMPFDHPSSRFCVLRFPSGALLLVCHYGVKDRSHLAACLSYDDGESFPHRLLLDERAKVSYPSGGICQDGHAIIAYDRERTGEREILLAYFTEEDIVSGRLGKNSYLKKLVAKGGTSIGV